MFGIHSNSIDKQLGNEKKILSVYNIKLYYIRTEHSVRITIMCRYQEKRFTYYTPLSRSKRPEVHRRRGPCFVIYIQSDLLSTLTPICFASIKYLFEF